MGLEGGREGVESLKLVVWRWRGGERSLTPCVVYRRDKVFPREYVNYFSPLFLKRGRQEGEGVKRASRDFDGLGP